jgi:hypothetical protein
MASGDTDIGGRSHRDCDVPLLGLPEKDGMLI